MQRLAHPDLEGAETCTAGADESGWHAEMLVHGAPSHQGAHGLAAIPRRYVGRLDDGTSGDPELRAGRPGDRLGDRLGDRMTFRAGPAPGPSKHSSPAAAFRVSWPHY